MNSIYMDNAALEKPKDEVIEVVINTMKNNWYNASATGYDEGRESNRIVENTRRLIANEIGCDQDEIIFTGSGSESNSLAIDGWLQANDKKYFTTTVLEHSSIAKNPRIHKLIGCDKNGFLNIDEIKTIHNELVSIQMCNSEIGTIQDIKTIAKILKDNGCVIHIDAVQGFGHIKINVKELNIDMMSATGQKIGSVLGSAFLYVRKGIKLNSIIHGSQENGLRGSTINVPSVSGLAKAIELIDYNEQKEIQKKRDYLIFKLLEMSNVSLNGSMDSRLPNNVNICIHGIDIDNQQLVAIADMSGYIIAAGSACSSGEKVPSHVLKAIGLSDKDANSSIRITISNYTTYDDLDRFAKDLNNIINQFKI